MEYGFVIKLVDYDGEKAWIAESTDLKGCVGQGNTIEAAIEELADNEKLWLDIARERGIEIPAPTVEKEQSEYSGKLTVRLGARLHRETAECAKKDGISINQHIINAVVSYNALESAAKVATRMIREEEYAKDNRSCSQPMFGYGHR